MTITKPFGLNDVHGIFPDPDLCRTLEKNLKHVPAELIPIHLTMLNQKQVGDMHGIGPKRLSQIHEGLRWHGRALRGEHVSVLEQLDLTFGPNPTGLGRLQAPASLLATFKPTDPDRAHLEISVGVIVELLVERCGSAELSVGDITCWSFSELHSLLRETSDGAFLEPVVVLGPLSTRLGTWGLSLKAEPAPVAAERPKFEGFGGFTKRDKVPDLVGAS